METIQSIYNVNQFLYDRNIDIKWNTSRNFLLGMQFNAKPL